MERKITYVAFDGTEFEDDRQCLAHERNLQVNAFGDHLRLWDEDMKPLDPAEEDALDDAFFIYADTPEAREWVEAELCIYCELGWDATFVCYRDDRWMDMVKEFDFLAKKMTAMAS